jgi:hypothetical protein
VVLRDQAVQIFVHDVLDVMLKHLHGKNNQTFGLHPLERRSQKRRLEAMPDQVVVLFPNQNDIEGLDLGEDVSERREPSVTLVDTEIRTLDRSAPRAFGVLSLH